MCPLIVIDGIPDPSADPFKLSADDIESVTVLKGTAAGALLWVNGYQRCDYLYDEEGGKKKEA